MQVFCTVTARNGERVPIEIADDATAAALRRQVANATKIPLDSLRLIFRGKMIKDDTSKKAIEEYKLESDCVLHCMGKPVEESADHNTTAGRTASDNAVAAASTIRSGTSAAAATASPPLAASRPAAESRPAPGNRSVGAAISRLRQNNPPSVYQTALTTLEKILSKIVGHPMEEKYRKGKAELSASVSEWMFAFRAVSSHSFLMFSQTTESRLSKETRRTCRRSRLHVGRGI
jgi:hypothetical protein